MLPLLGLITPWWAFVFMCIGIIAVITAVVTLFVIFADDAPDRFSKTIYPVDSDEFLQAIAGLSNSPLKYGEEVRILQNGDEFLPCLLSTLKSAKNSITFTVYIWEDGKMSEAIFAVLIEKANDGVEVRLLLDGFGGLKTPQKKLKELENAGGKVDVFRPIRLGRFMRAHKRMHRRAIVIDGKIGFIGGGAVADKWLGSGDSDKHWRDTMFEVRGEMAVGLQSAFAELWAGTNGEILIGPKFYPASSTLSTPKILNQFINIISSPASDTEPLNKMFWLSIVCAQSKIYITNSYLVPDKFILKALKEKAKAGVDVRILIPNRKTDAMPIRYATHYYYEELMKAGVVIYEYQPAMMHSKVMVIDDKWSVIGSANMDRRSMSLNIENVIGVLDTELGKGLNKMFMNDMKKSQLIKLRKWRKRDFLRRFLEVFFINFVKQY